MTTLTDEQYMAILRRTQYQNTAALRRMADECFAAGRASVYRLMSDAERDAWLRGDASPTSHGEKK